MALSAEGGEVLLSEGESIATCLLTLLVGEVAMPGGGPAPRLLLAAEVCAGDKALAPATGGKGVADL